MRSSSTPLHKDNKIVTSELFPFTHHKPRLLPESDLFFFVKHAPIKCGTVCDNMAGYLKGHNFKRLINKSYAIQCTAKFVLKTKSQLMGITDCLRVLSVYIN